MNTKIIRLTFMVALVLLFMGCKEDEEVKNLQVTQVENFYEPGNGKSVELQSSESAMLYFEWEPARAEDSGMVLYEIAFDKTGGDFSKPVFIMPSNNNGGSNYINVTHKQLNKIAAMMGIESAQQGTFKWTVFSSKGIKPVKAKQERTLTVTRLAGFAEMPEKVYLTGAATEGGEDLSKAIIFKEINEGEFEIFSRLIAGQTFKFVDGTAGTPRSFYNTGELLKEDGTCTISTTGVYQIKLDFTTGVCTFREITRVSLFVNSPQEYIDLPYKGLGVWEALNVTPTRSSTDDRYKFRMSSIVNGAEKETEWRTVLPNDSRPGNNPNPNFYWMRERDNVEQWTNNEIWKINWPSPGNLNWDANALDISFILKSDGPYTHTLVFK